MASKSVTAEEIADMGKLYKAELKRLAKESPDKDVPKSTWRVIVPATSGEMADSARLDVAYRVANAMGWKPVADALRDQDRKVISKWLEASGARNMTPWGKRAESAPEVEAAADPYTGMTKSQLLDAAKDAGLEISSRTAKADIEIALANAANEDPAERVAREAKAKAQKHAAKKVEEPVGPDEDETPMNEDEADALAAEVAFLESV